MKAAREAVRHVKGASSGVFVWMRGDNDQAVEEDGGASGDDRYASGSASKRRRGFC